VYVYGGNICTGPNHVLTTVRGYCYIQTRRTEFTINYRNSFKLPLAVVDFLLHTNEAAYQGSPTIRRRLLFATVFKYHDGVRVIFRYKKEKGKGAHAELGVFRVIELL